MEELSTNIINEEVIRFTFDPQEMDSEGSDFSYSSSISMMSTFDDVDEDTVDSENYDMEVDFFMFDSPPPPNWAVMSVATLQELIQKHRETRTVGKFLSQIDTDSNYYQPIYSDPVVHDVPNIHYEVEDEPQVPRYLVEKRYRTMLGFACLDTDGKRGKEKIQLIIETAKCLHLNMKHFLATSGKIFKLDVDEDRWVYDKTGVETPLQLLCQNMENASTESFRLICHTWPRVVHVRENEDNDAPLLAHVLYYNHMYGSANDHFERLKAITDVLFEAAEKTKEGARGLILESEKRNVIVEDFCEACEENKQEHTAFHYVTAFYHRPEEVLPLFLKWCPDALKYMSIADEGGDTRPFHNIFFNCGSYESLVKSIEAFLQYSTLEALAIGLLSKDGWRSACVFDLLIHALEESTTLKYKRTCDHEYSLKVEEHWQVHLKNVVDTLLERKDSRGRSLLHYISANNGIDLDLELHFSRLYYYKQLKKEYEASGREWPYDPSDHVRFTFDDLDLGEELGREVKKYIESQRRENHTKAAEFLKWILNKKPSLAFAVDIDALNPFQYAVSIGKKWYGGLDVVAKLVPGWARSSKNTSLYPVAIAACSYGDGEEALDAIFELLRFDVSVLLD